MKWYRHVLPPVCLYLWHIASTTQERKKASGTKLYLGGRQGGGGVFFLSRPLATALSMGFMWDRYKKTNGYVILFPILSNTSAYHKPKDTYHKYNFLSL